MDQDQFNQITAGTTRRHDCIARQVDNGFVLAGTVRYVDGTGVLKLQQQFEAVAGDDQTAANLAGAFIVAGTFTA
jgi:hypothetical protein